MFDADFDQHSVYRGTPNPERDAAWKQLWDREQPLCREPRPVKRAEQLMFLGGAINIPADKLASLNKSDGVERLQTPPEKGGGTAAILEFHHLLHCVVAPQCP